MPRVNQARNRLEHFTPTRGLMLSVFEELDCFGQNKLTASTLEEAAVQVGLNAQQIKRFYSMLDPQNRGYITMRDWGNDALTNQVMGFTRLYVQATRGMHGKMMDAREVRGEQHARHEAATSCKSITLPCLRANYRSVTYVF